MPRLHLVADAIKSLRRIDTELASQVNQCEKYRKTPFHASWVSVVKFIAERGLAFRDDENVLLPRKHFKKIF